MTEMPPQVWIHAGTPRPDLVRPPVNAARFVLNKPWGGLWTSSLDAEAGCDWVRFHLESYSDERTFRGWLLIPSPTARLAVVDSQADLLALYGRYGLVREPVGPWEASLDWERLAADHDGLHLTHRGQRETHLPLDSPITLNGWDCESTWWARWAFEGEPVAWRYEAAARDPEADEDDDAE